MPNQHSTEKKKLIYERNITLIGIAVTLFASSVFVSLIVSEIITNIFIHHTIAALQQTLFVLIALFLIYGNILYLAMRYGRINRYIHFKKTPRAKLESFAFSSDQVPSLSLLVPAYKEEIPIITMTLLSCVFQEYPDKKITLLIDNPPNPANQDDKELLEATRKIPQEIIAAIRPMRERLTQILQEFKTRSNAAFDVNKECANIAAIEQEVAEWFHAFQNSFSKKNNIERFFVNKIVRQLEKECRARAKKYRTLSASKNKKTVTVSQLFSKYYHLLSLFSADITSFERKTFENLSHESNKAMNLNSYLAVMGHSFEISTRGDKRFIFPHKEGPIHFPTSDYVITLDADSMLFPDYALRLIQRMERKGNERIAVIQTPYNTYPNATTILERVAGATTDIQYLIHQGFTAINATFWVGANALLRKKALEDIKAVEKERGYDVVRYVQDRTVIEDTESSIDLILKGWRLHNYPDILSFSATPPDFGALIIQRRRWANGGLIILPKLIKYLFFGKTQLRKRAKESVIRAHYLTSVAGVNIGLLILMIYHFRGDLQVGWLMLASVSYFIFYGRDLILIKYNIVDLFRVYALNLLLLPINIGGVLKSLQQMITRKKIPFGRTPKIQDRTAISPLYFFAELGLAAYLF
ncbi:glycosyltransferase, partial [Candidatus Parcubacteria bacterium]